MYSVCKRLRKQDGVSKVLNKEICIIIKVIVQRTQSDWTAYGIRSGGVRCTMTDRYQLRTDVYVINKGLRVLRWQGYHRY